MAASLLLSLQTLTGQLTVAASFAVFWACFIETVRWPIGRHIRGAEWWPRALPNQINVMVNFGYPKGKTTEDMAEHGFVWIITMCITHIVSASLMAPVVLLGWEASGESGQLLFFLGSLSEVGFDIYDWTKAFLLTFCPGPFHFLGPPGPVKSFVLICILHHSAVLGMTIPMNLRYPGMAAYHQIGFSLLVSAGICYLAGQYKFTLDAKTEEGLKSVKRIISVQFVVNWLTRIIFWFPAVYKTLSAFHAAQDWPYLIGGSLGALGMSLYNLLIAADATQAFLKWLPRTVGKEA